MLLKHIVLCFLYHLAVSVCSSTSRKTLTPARGHQLLEGVVNLTNSLLEVTPYLNSSLAEIPSNCVQMSCKFVCFNGISTDIEIDILMLSQKNNSFCSHIEELRLYNYLFPGAKLCHGFLGSYSDRVKILYLASAHVTDIEAGAFAHGIFKEIYFENLQLTELRRDFFNGISSNFNTLSIIQRQMPIQTVNTDFLCNVKYLIKSLTLQVGFKSAGNLTGDDFLLNNLAYADFSYNDLGSSMEYTALSKASMLEWLDLSSSNLDYIPPFTFADFTKTLQYLDLSHNKLKTVSRNIFGWREMPRDLKIYAEGNEWSCSCDLQQEMRLMILHLKTVLVCSEPAVYQGLSVFDDQICGTEVESFASTVATTLKSSNEEGHINETTIQHDHHLYTPEHTTELQLNAPSDYFMKLHCLTKLPNRLESTVHFLHWPYIVFDLVPQGSLHVDVVVKSSEKPYSTFGLIWFSKVASKRYEMKINYNKYGLGCYKNISVVTTVKDLTPNTAYTFCLVLKGQLTVSPFNCKSIHVSNDLAIKNSEAWITRDMKITGLVLLIFGIATFLFAGILIMYLLLKRKPLLVKRSQRRRLLKDSKEEIAVLSQRKFIRTIKEQDEKLVRSGPFTIFPNRRMSNDSEASYNSYINANVYEVIPAFENLNEKITNDFQTRPKATSVEINNQDADSCYLTPLETVPSSGSFVQYAEIPCLAKRNSNDVLPQLPADVPPPVRSSLIKTAQNKTDYAQIGDICFLDSHI